MAVSKSQVVNVAYCCVTFVRLIKSANNCGSDAKDKSSFWSGCNDFALLSVGCNDFALGVVMIILFYKIK